MRNTYLWCLIILLFILTGCTNKQQSLPLPEREGDIHFQAFVEEVPTEGESDPEYERMYDLVAKMQGNEAIDLTQVDVQVKKEAPIQAHGEEIVRFPTYFILNREGIVLKTTNLDEVAEYIDRAGAPD
ncbi:hypothetical protein [Halobacillus aidingensis]|uniref:Uncharacterized protein n=1 Tax=Halobacillus aidingensis TaxID=240303 RepID=A0A1H0Q5D1_HALAD|nr:hypothetical protein [Halobacillus aidingensis]SDP12255.1 hypothetical protein SAMN05421677_11256 [Halobacillus aidingensis]